MFDNLKQLGKLKQMKEILEKEKGTEEVKGVKITINGKMEVEEVILNPELSSDEQAAAVKQCFNQVVKKVQQKAAGKMFQG